MCCPSSILCALNSARHPKFSIPSYTFCIHRILPVNIHQTQKAAATDNFSITCRLTLKYEAYSVPLPSRFLPKLSKTHVSFFSLNYLIFNQDTLNTQDLHTPPKDLINGVPKLIGCTHLCPGCESHRLGTGFVTFWENQKVHMPLHNHCVPLFVLPPHGQCLFRIHLAGPGLTYPQAPQTSIQIRRF